MDLKSERERVLALLECAGLLLGDHLKAAIVDGHSADQLGATLHRAAKLKDIAVRGEGLSALQNDETEILTTGGFPSASGSEASASSNPGGLTAIDIAREARLFRAEQAKSGIEMSIVDSVHAVRRRYGLRPDQGGLPAGWGTT